MQGTRRDLRRAALATPLALLALALGAVAAPASSPALGFVTVGGAPALAPGDVALGALAATAPLSLTVVLAPRDPGGLAALAGAVSTPGSPSYHHYLTTAQFAARFGAAPATVAQVDATLRGEGLQPGPLAENGLSLNVSTDAGTASQAFGVTLRRYRDRTGASVFANATAPHIPASLSGAVTDVLGLDDQAAAAPAGLVRGRAHALVRGAEQPLTGAGPAPCAAASARAGASGPYTINEIAHAYGIDGLYAGGDTGSGTTVALFELEAYTPGDIASFQTCFGTSATVTPIPIDGGPGAPSGQDPGLESVLDIENAVGLAPASTVDVYQGPNTVQGVEDTFQTIIQDDRAQVISDSWGLCEPDNDPGLTADENTLFEEAATQGQSVFVASGDAGSEGCSASTQLAVDDPASQPWVTAVGGTALEAAGPPATQTAWGSGGGGVSSSWPMPSYQTGPGVINPSYSSGVPCANSPGYCREVPDVSADAAPSTGYVVYYGGFPNTHWGVVGGTSAAAPLWAALTALADASREGDCASAPLGFLNRDLYGIAAGAGASAAFDDVTTGDNNPSGSGAYPATAGYDMATGLGTPIATGGATAGLVAQLCADTSGAASPAIPPTVTAVSPAEAPPGATVTIAGSGFAAGASVAFGGTPAAAVAVAGPDQLSATVPAGSGAVDVTVTTGAGTSAAGAGGVFTYAPTEAIGAPARGAAYTQGETVRADFSCAASTPAAPACDGTTPAGAALDTAQLGPAQFTVTATDANGVSTSQTVAYTVVAAPAATITVPAAGATYIQGRHVTASFACSTTAPVVIATCAGTVASGAPLANGPAGVHSFTLAATDSNGVTTTASVSYTIVAAHPTVGRLRQSASVWLERRARAARLPVGTTFSFSLDQAATVLLRFTRSADGRVASGRCVAMRAAVRHAPRCTRSLGAGAVALSAPAGTDTIQFTGRTSFGLLPPGSYRVSVSATGLGGASSPTAGLTFTVARAARPSAGALRRRGARRPVGLRLLG